MAARLAGAAAQLIGAQCLLLRAGSRELVQVLGEGDALPSTSIRSRSAPCSISAPSTDPRGAEELRTALDADAAHVVMLRRGAPGPRDQPLVFPSSALPALAQRLLVEDDGSTSCLMFLDRPQRHQCAAFCSPPSASPTRKRASSGPARDG